MATDRVEELNFTPEIVIGVFRTMLNFCVQKTELQGLEHGHITRALLSHALMCLPASKQDNFGYYVEATMGEFNPQEALSLDTKMAPFTRSDCVRELFGDGKVTFMRNYE
jgi:hypothetical protein